jgi:hypothetical protein
MKALMTAVRRVMTSVSLMVVYLAVALDHYLAEMMDEWKATR